VLASRMNRGAIWLGARQPAVGDMTRLTSSRAYPCDDSRSLPGNPISDGPSAGSPRACDSASAHRLLRSSPHLRHARLTSLSPVRPGECRRLAQGGEQARSCLRDTLPVPIENWCCAEVEALAMSLTRFCLLALDPHDRGSARFFSSRNQARLRFVVRPSSLGEECAIAAAHLGIHQLRLKNPALACSSDRPDPDF